MIGIAEQRIYDKQSAPSVTSIAPDSEMEAVMRAHVDCINMLQSAMTELERRLKPVLPQVVPEVNEEPRNNAQGNLCPLARTLETQSFRINEMTEDVRRILGDLRI